MFPRLRWQAFRVAERADAKMMNAFKKVFGEPKEVVIAWGDWSWKLGAYVVCSTRCCLLTAGCHSWLAWLGRFLACPTGAKSEAVR